ncbi:hypothetical protein KJ785_01820 [Patescibacteria group bacterium]|nr:hypothetical protein [Patescibacteria group bacterium]
MPWTKVPGNREEGAMEAFDINEVADAIRHKTFFPRSFFKLREIFCMASRRARNYSSAARIHARGGEKNAAELAERSANSAEMVAEAIRDHFGGQWPQIIGFRRISGEILATKLDRREAIELPTSVGDGACFIRTIDGLGGTPQQAIGFSDGDLWVAEWKNGGFLRPLGAEEIPKGWELFPANWGGPLAILGVEEPLED